MNQLQLWAVTAALGVAAGAASAQTETQPQTTERTAPVPSTPQTEGTAADRTPPGETPTREPSETMPDSPVGDQTQGTAADRTPPGEEAGAGSTRIAAAGTTDTRMARHRVSMLIGMKVTNYAGEPLGAIEDVVLDENGRISHVVVDRSAVAGGAGLVAVPWSVASTMIKGSNLVMDENRLQKAPSFDEQRWPDVSGSRWSGESDRYWRASGATSTTR